MHTITVGWMYPNLLNLHGERGSVQALVEAGKNLGIQVDILRIEDFNDPIPFEKLDMLIFLPGEIAVFSAIMSGLSEQKGALSAFIESGNYLLAIGSSGLLFGNSIIRENGTELNGLGYLDMSAKERKYVWGDDLHIRLLDTKQELIGSQIQMADVEAKQPLGETIYGMGNNNTGAEGARWKNLIYTNCLGPLFVKNPWFAEDILKSICLKKFLGISSAANNKIASDSFNATLHFIQNKPKQ